MTFRDEPRWRPSVLIDLAALLLAVLILAVGFWGA